MSRSKAWVDEAARVRIAHAINKQMAVLRDRRKPDRVSNEYLRGVADTLVNIYTLNALDTFYEDDVELPIDDMTNADALFDLMTSRAPELPEIERRAPTRSPLRPSVRFHVMKRDGYRCQLCGKASGEALRLEIDHKVPVAKGGSDEYENLWTLCWECNSGKSDSDL